jgi:electron transfer flavoprotein-quinone oxidoreductase
MPSEFDVIVVGAGPAGSATALSLARKGVNVLMLEKGKVPGERNMTGGVLYGEFTRGYGMIDLVPDFEKSAPVQRRIISNEVFVLSHPDWDGGKFRYYRMTENSLPSKAGFFPMGFDTGHDYTVLRRSFDRWLADYAVRAGAMLATETTAEGLLMEGGAVVGIRTTHEEIRADLVVDCSGVTSTLVSEAGLRENLVPRQLYHGIKRVYSLEPETLEKRFRVRPGDGRAIFFLGPFMHGIGGGSFLYTNLDSLSVGIVASMDSMIRGTTENFTEVGKLADTLDDLAGHPMLAELLEGADVEEYAAHNVPKGYKCILKRPYADGFMAAGDALGSFVKIGPMIDGMRRAIASGMMAAETYVRASSSGSFRGRNLAHYRDLLSPVYDDVNRSGRDGFIAESSVVYSTLPKLLFWSRFMVKTGAIKTKPPPATRKDAIQRIQDGTSLLQYDEDEEYSHIKVDEALASQSITKPWVPACPVNCYTLVTAKGVFASFKDLYEYNLGVLMKGGQTGEGASRKARQQTLEDVASGRLKFDHVACVACGTCGAIGPPEMVTFTHERDGHGVRYRYG